MSTQIKTRGRNLIGERVRATRLAHQPPITQNDLSARLHVLGVEIDRAGISKIETGNREVTDVELVAIAKSLKVTVESLLKESGAAKRPAR